MRNQMRDGTFDWENNPIAIAKQDDDMYVVGNWPIGDTWMGRVA